MADGRKNNGGKRSGAGRKPKRIEVGLPLLLDKCWTESQREECIQKLAEKAATGDMEAIKLLMAYTYGKPRESHDVTHRGAVEIHYVNDWRNESS